MVRTSTKESTEPKKRSSSSAGGTKRPPSAYNIFMKEELPKFKAKNPDLNHKEAFKRVAESWKTHPSNPKNTAAAA